MKTLFLLRHAKSSWEQKELRDFERPLADRGLNDIKTMGQRFVQKDKQVECIITSPAVRAKATAMLFAREIGYPEDDISANPELYFAGAPMFMKAASLIDENFQWYQLPRQPDAPIDLLVIDGPSGFIQPQSRYPALPLLYPRRATQCQVYLDDAARNDEQQIVRRWLASYPEFQYRYLATERGCSILSRS